MAQFGNNIISPDASGLETRRFHLTPERVSDIAVRRNVVAEAEALVMQAELNSTSAPQSKRQEDFTLGA